jgi:hypothetical protein
MRRILPSTSASLWSVAVAALAAIPFLPAFVGNRVFFVRDLSEFFWPRYLWLRHEWLAGHFPLWDPFVGGGQAAYSDALHQMFMPLAIVARLIGSEVFGFNFWIAVPIPLAAIGAFAFLRRRFTAHASAIGAVAFALCGPNVASADFPNLSWSVAGLPWVLWATDLVVTTPQLRYVALLGVTVALQALAGEPVTFFTSAGVAGTYALVVGSRDEDEWTPARALRSGIVTACGMAIGTALAAVQIVPMMAAARLADRSGDIGQDTWSLRPQALLETVWAHLYGNYYTVQDLKEVPWMGMMYTGREPLLFSIYFGVPLLALAAFGLGGTAPRRWRLFWLTTGFVGVIAAFGSYTPIYPFLRDHVPPFTSFRFPVKYILATTMAIAAGAAAGWDVLWEGQPAAPGSGDRRRQRRAWWVSTAFATIVGLLAGAVAVAMLVFPAQTSGVAQWIGEAFGDETKRAGLFMQQTIPVGAGPVVAGALATAVLLTWARRTFGTAAARVALVAFACLVAGDLVVHAWGVNPVIDVKWYDEPKWLALAKNDPTTRFYVGGKMGGSLQSMDFDGSRGYENAPGLTGSPSRAALSINAAFYPSAWGAREMISYDLPVVWPEPYKPMTERFGKATRAERDLFLDRTAARFRVLPQRRAGTRVPVATIPQFWESFVYDWGPENVAHRASVVPGVRVVSDVDDQLEAMFTGDWDHRTTALVERVPPPAGRPGAPAPPAATIVQESSGNVTIEASAGPGGGHLVLLDTYSPDWRATVDGEPAEMVRANALFRAVHLAEGHHTVRFDYQPRALVWGSAVSAAGLLATLGLLALGRRRPVPVGVTATAADDLSYGAA